MPPAKRDKKLRVYFGVDQTGALTRKGGPPKPLPAALLIEDPSGPRLSLANLPSLNQKCIAEALATRGLEPQKVEILVDCVLGLPTEALREVGNTSMNLLFQKAFRYQKKFGLGRKSAEEFFAREFSSVYEMNELPRRACERLAKANSVFQSRPYQRNIQTGTFRIWSDLGGDLESALARDQERIGTPRADWFWLWRHEPYERKPKTSRRIWIGEGYPSLSWRTIANAKTREPESLMKTLRGRFPELKLPRLSPRGPVAMSADHADAVVLAVHLWSQKGFEGHDSNSSERETKALAFQGEGWIFGLRTDGSLLGS